LRGERHLPLLERIGVAAADEERESIAIGGK